ncbi:uncharacterized protein LOC118438081 [Folsomia candida]|uniref:uncharacterized protein LOC118438081 n=1 Tax=Folsomia candida TaxID=158441 RepID=UPI0016052A0C|nr:uncharacterized protein LOC118438081 [Folsomia candida]
MESPPSTINAQDMALQNPLILTKILQNNSVSLTSCRLVSQFWNEVVLSLPNTRLSLKLNHNDEDCDEALQFFGLCFSLDKRLAQRVSAESGTFSIDWRLMHICGKFGDWVQILEIYLSEEDCLKSTCQVLKYCCPNLKQLRIDCDFVDARNVDLFPPDEEQILPVKPNLTLFTLTCLDFDPEIWFVPAIAILIQLVVKASPNLREVTIPWGFYPNLANSKCLESLTI